MADYYLHIKALHLIFVVTWFAGLFYIPRLFVYHIEAQDKLPLERDILSRQLKMMSKRLWLIITWPSAILATIFALALIAIVPSWLWQPWMWLKLAFVFGLILYHLKLHQMYRELQGDIFRHSSIRMRVWNEGATLFLFAIVFLVILKNTIDWIYGLLGLVVLSGSLFWAIKSYKRSREKRS
jgi:protoporphyrinogen IX oxidase